MEKAMRSDLYTKSFNGFWGKNKPLVDTTEIQGICIILTFTLVSFCLHDKCFSEESCLQLVKEPSPWATP